MQIVMDFRYTIGSHELQIKGELKEKVIGDRKRIEQVLINLITNAIKYSPNADKIIIHLSSTNEQIVVSVQDFGFGIAKRYFMLSLSGSDTYHSSFFPQDILSLTNTRYEI